jgi:hypothetical protein
MEVLEVASKPHLVSDGCVATRLKMLTYYRVCCAFDSTCALPSNTILGFETTSKTNQPPVCSRWLIFGTLT